SFAFLRANPETTGQWTDDDLAAFIKNKSARFVASGIDYPLYQGHLAHGTAFATLDQTYRKAQIRRRHKLAPGTKQLVYFNCFLDVSDDADRRYADARLLRADGAQATYPGQQHERLFFPTSSNRFGQDMAKIVDTIIGSIGADGVYWDEAEMSSDAY